MVQFHLYQMDMQLLMGFIDINNNDLGVYNCLVANDNSKRKYYPVFIWGGYEINGNGQITVSLPALESGFKYDDYKIYESRVNCSYDTNLVLARKVISGTTLICTYTVASTGAAATQGIIYTGFMLIALKV